MIECNFFFQYSPWQGRLISVKAVQEGNNVLIKVLYVLRRMSRRCGLVDNDLMEFVNARRACARG